MGACDGAWWRVCRGGAGLGRERLQLYLPLAARTSLAVTGNEQSKRDILKVIFLWALREEFDDQED